mmetsp:Transcript_6790/g.12577  ORF Transcript_6790/g.12577 Transcript_6790/m.12577 type:complete len:234 (+) Transcript_6790:307-1008(+)
MSRFPIDLSSCWARLQSLSLCNDFFARWKAYPTPLHVFMAVGKQTPVDNKELFTIRTILIRWKFRPGVHPPHGNPLACHLVVIHFKDVSPVCFLFVLTSFVVDMKWIDSFISIGHLQQFHHYCASIVVNPGFMFGPNRISHIISFWKFSVLIFESSLQYQEFFSPDMFMQREFAVWFVFHNRGCPRFFIPDSIQHESVHVVRRGWNELACIKIDARKCFEVCIDLHCDDDNEC